MKVPVIYKDLPSELKGRSMGLWIEIDNKYKDDIGLLKHEQCHVRQFMRFFIPMMSIAIGLMFTPYVLLAPLFIMASVGHGILYKVSKQYKYDSEVEAFGYSVAYGGRNIHEIRNSLKNYYKIPDEILADYYVDIELATDKAEDA